MSFDLILPFLSPVEALIRDDQISEIMVNAGGRVWVESRGRLKKRADLNVSERDLRRACRNIARVLGHDVGEEKPLLDARLPDGSRVAAVFPPCSLGGAVLTIRKFPRQAMDASRLVELGTLPEQWVALLRRGLAERRWNMLISGGTATGKTTRSTPWPGSFPSPSA